jgi:hypothetical protein
MSGGYGSWGWAGQWTSAITGGSRKVRRVRASEGWSARLALFLFRFLLLNLPRSRTEKNKNKSKKMKASVTPHPRYTALSSSAASD